MKLSQLFSDGKFVITGEVGPAKGTHVEETLEGADIMRPCVDAINVTDNQSAVMRLSSLVICHLLKRRALEPVVQFTCRDRNRLALQSDLLSAAVLGIQNVLCLTGDHLTLGDHPQAKPVYDIDSVQLLMAARSLESGEDLSGEKLDGTPSFCLGAVVNPGADPIEPQLIKMEKKIEAGAEFFQTQAVYEPEVFEQFMKRAGQFGVPVMVGIVPLKSAGMAKYMTQNVAGVNVPEPLIKKMADTPKNARKQVSAEIAADLIRKMKDMCQGVHLMPLGWDALVPEILSQAGLYSPAET